LPTSDNNNNNNNSTGIAIAQWPFAKLWAYCCVIFPLSSIELQKPLQLEAILGMLSEGRHGIRRNFPGGGKVGILLIFFRLLAMQHKWMCTKKKMFNVTAIVGSSVFFVRKLYTE